MITWRRETNGDWFGEGIRFRYAAQRTIQQQGKWELWRMDRTNPIASWVRTEPTILYANAQEAIIWAEALERTKR